MDVRLDQRIALVSGASKGIGLSCARVFAQAGARVVAVARDAKRLDEAVRDLVAQGLAVQGMTADLSDASQAQALAARSRPRWAPSMYW